MSVPAVSIIGPSESGKTTLLSRLLPALKAQNVRAAVIKHTSHVHPMHKPGSDTDKLEQAGAQTVGFATPQGLSLHFPGGLETMLPKVQALFAGEVDLILVEGWKDGPLPKIEVWREAIGPRLAEGNDDLWAVITDDPSPTEVESFTTSDVEGIAKLIKDRMKGGAKGKKRAAK